MVSNLASLPLDIGWSLCAVLHMSSPSRHMGTSYFSRGQLSRSTPCLFRIFTNLLPHVWDATKFVGCSTHITHFVTIHVHDFLVILVDWFSKVATYWLSWTISGHEFQWETDWSTAEGPYEIADHCISKNSNLLILLNAWLDSGEDLEENHDWQTLNYWAARTRPLWSNGNDDNDSDSSQDATKPSLTSDSGSNETIVVICNRSGQENGPFISFISCQMFIIFS